MIFCTGLHRTGTSSLHKALEHLGYEMQQDEGTFRANLTDEACHKIVREHSNVNRRGMPFNIYPELLKALHPDATFIHTERNEDDWFRSIQTNWQYEVIPMHDFYYGGPINKDRYIEKYRAHNKKIREIFPDILIMNITNGDGWEKLCPYLGKGIPEIPYPHANKTMI